MGYRVNSPGDPDADVLGGKGAALGLEYIHEARGHFR